jgi:hypothetical protein
VIVQGVSLIAKVDVRYAGRNLRSGEAFEAVSERDATTLKLLGKADDPPKPRKTTLARKDLVAAPSDADPSPVRPKRQYQRRDLVAEGPRESPPE